MIDESLARMHAHRNNIRRQLLQTKLTELERQYVEQRLSEELAALETDANTALPFRLPSPRTPPERVNHVGPWQDRNKLANAEHLKLPQTLLAITVRNPGSWVLDRRHRRPRGRELVEETLPPRRILPVPELLRPRPIQHALNPAADPAGGLGPGPSRDSGCRACQGRPAAEGPSGPGRS
jgi:hypothetical protein